MDKTILHADLNNFYASVELVLNPALRGKPIAVCGDPKKRHGIVLAKCNIAKAAGIKTGDTLRQAREKCPELIAVPPSHNIYSEYSKKVFDIYTRFTDRVERFGLDECWLDVTHSMTLFGTGKQIADKLRKLVKTELGLTISVGVSFTKVFAKIGSDMKKPDATTVITRENYKDLIWKLPVSDMMSVGKRIAGRLKDYNILTIKDLACADIKIMTKLLGINGARMIENANGISNETVSLSTARRIPKSIGHGATMPQDIKDFNGMKVLIYALSEMVATRLRKQGMSANGVSLFIRNNEFGGTGSHRLMQFSTDTSSDIADGAMKIFEDIYDFKTMLPVRMAAVTVYNLTPGDTAQLNFFNENEKQSKLEHSIDKVRERFGYNILQRGIIMSDASDFDDFIPDEENIPFMRT